MPTRAERQFFRPSIPGWPHPCAILFSAYSKGSARPMMPRPSLWKCRGSSWCLRGERRSRPSNMEMRRHSVCEAGNFCILESIRGYVLFHEHPTSHWALFSTRRGFASQFIRELFGQPEGRRMSSPNICGNGGLPRLSAQRGCICTLC